MIEIFNIHINIDWIDCIRKTPEEFPQKSETNKAEEQYLQLDYKWF